MNRCVKLVLAVVRASVSVAVLAVMFLLAPAGLVFETVELIRMRSSADAVIITAEAERDGRHTGRPRIVYRYTVGGREYESSRYLPGFLGNRGSWIGGADAASRYKDGQQVTVHYRAADPVQACLAYGWFKCSVGLTALAWGLIVNSRWGSRGGRWRWAATMAVPLYAVGCLFIGPDAIAPSRVHWHLAAWFVIAMVLLVYSVLGQALAVHLRRRPGGP